MWSAWPPAAQNLAPGSAAPQSFASAARRRQPADKQLSKTIGLRRLRDSFHPNKQHWKRRSQEATRGDESSNLNLIFHEQAELSHRPSRRALRGSALRGSAGSSPDLLQFEHFFLTPGNSDSHLKSPLCLLCLFFFGACQRPFSSSADSTARASLRGSFGGHQSRLPQRDLHGPHTNRDSEAIMRITGRG